jgi:4-diphosphocytidyl-2-C-methyl-D-erythritol kinase
MICVTLPSPAKINLFLHILGRRQDGYHNLQTLFQLLDYGDQITFTATKNRQIALTDQLEGVAAQDNLIVRAATILQNATNCEWGCEIQLQKNLPMGAGLGGGSSNAATTLVGLNYLWQCNLTPDQLAEMGRQLGADVPVFVRGQSAFAEGIGEQLTPIELDRPWYLVVTPKIKVSTHEIFSHSELTRNSQAIKIRALSGKQYRNDCQSVVEKLYPGVKQVLDWLQRYKNPLMTGTGASVFCRFDSEIEARRAQTEIPKQWDSFVARGINQSPLHKQLKNL